MADTGILSGLVGARIGLVWEKSSFASSIPRIIFGLGGAPTHEPAHSSYKDN
jgi:hypothetical protein